MATDGDFANFRAVYDELTDEVDRASCQFMPDHLGNWFRTLDGTPRVAGIIKSLQENVDYETWRHALTRAVAPVLFNWPKEPDKALGMKLRLFRAFVEGGPDTIVNFGYSFIGQKKNGNANAKDVIEQIFMPTARELRRYLETELAGVPASDRVVPLDHNSTSYRELVDNLEQLENALRSSNEYSDEIEKGQRIAEVWAARRLLEAGQVRVDALVAVLRPVIIQFTTKVKDNLITAAALAVSSGIIAWLGHIL